MTRAIAFSFLALLATSALATMAALLAPGPRGISDWARPGEAAHEGGSIALLALDMNPAGNTIADAPPGNVEQTRLGAVESCLEVTHPATFDVDLVVSGYPTATDSLVAYDITLTFPAGLQLTNSVTGNVPALGRTLLSADPQSGPSFFPQIDEPNYGVGPPLAGPATHAAVALDFAQDDPDESVDGEENSDGFLIRYTFKTTAAGPASIPLTLGTTSNFVLDDAGSEAPMPIAKVQNGVVAVGRSCAGIGPPPGPTGTGTPAAAQTPSTGTPGAGSGTPGAGDSGTPGAGDNGTPGTGSGTPGADNGTPGADNGTPGAADGKGETGGSDGGIGTAGWIAIGVGAGAAVLAALTGGWMIRARRRKQA
jgi:hypothetical protein